MPIELRLPIPPWQNTLKLSSDSDGHSPNFGEAWDMIEMDSVVDLDQGMYDLMLDLASCQNARSTWFKANYCRGAEI